MSLPRRGASVLLPLVLLCAACSSTEDSDSPASFATVGGTVAPTSQAPRTTDATPATAPTTEATPMTELEVEPLHVLVTNDDGIGAPGIDSLVAALLELEGVEVMVVAPAENQSGTSMSLTDGELTATDAATASGYPALTVAGFPVDSVRWALANLETDFDVVVSGSNSGQNIGDFSALSGTVGAARFAAQQGLPAIAVSQGLVPDGDIVFQSSVSALIDWFAANRADYETGTVSLTSINSPTCPNGVRGVVEVPLGALDERDALAFDCESTVDDVDAFANGLTAITDLPIQI